MQYFDEVGDDPDMGALEVGYFCFEREDAAGGGTCANGRPYVDTQTGITSIGGVEATVCGLALTTCSAYKDYLSKPCADANDNSSCGDSRFESDAYCRVLAAPSMYRCTTPCSSALDCRAGYFCNTNVVPSACSL
jgi:hypothetical protein